MNNPAPRPYPPSRIAVAREDSSLDSTSGPRSADTSEGSEKREARGQLLARLYDTIATNERAFLRGFIMHTVRLVLVAALASLGFVSLWAGSTYAQSAREAPDPESVARWVEELSHPELARREAATRELIGAGEAAARRVRPLCDAVDPALSMRARRIYGAVFGVDPETHDRVRRILADSGSGRLGVVNAADRLAELPEGALDLAMRSLESTRRNRAHAPLAVELHVRRALDHITAGTDRGDAEHASVLAHGAAAAAPLLRVVGDAKAPRMRRAHALWLYSLVAGADRGTGLRGLVSDADPIVRREAASAVAESLREADLPGISKALGGRASTERALLADAAARNVPLDELRKRLADNRADTASFAAIAIGKLRSEKALDALTKELEGEKRTEVREAIAAALGDIQLEGSTRQLAELYAGESNPGVRAAAISALRPRAQERAARIALSTAIVDENEAVRLLAIDGLVAHGNSNAVPALVHAASTDSSQAVRSRVLAGLRQLVDNGPGATGTLDDDARNWQRWLDRNNNRFEGEDLPWFRDSRDADRIVRGVRDYIRREFFYFDKKELVDTDSLDAAARAAMQRHFGGEESRPSDAVKIEGFERAVVERVLNATASRGPEHFFRALGAIPFESDKSDLVRLTNAAADGMVRSLGDRFSRLTLSNDAEGNVRPGWLPGLLDDNDRTNGFILDEKDGSWWVDFVLYDSPAFYAGIQPGDQVVKIGKKFTGEMTSAEIRKAVNEENDFSILRDGWNRPYAFSLTPEAPDDDRTVVHRVLPGKIGYLRLKAFEPACSVKIEQALLEMENDGIVGLVLDLRNNPGGTVVDATEIVDKFLPAGKLISVNVTRGPNGEEVDEDVRATDAPSDRSYPVAVLVNRSSASASEMTSGSLQGNERAIVLGETTFGKGIGQSGTQFPGFSSDTALGTTRSVYAVTLTMMRYYLPEGKRSIHLVGVEPDIPVRERNLRGVLLDRVMRVRQSSYLDEYVTELIEKDADTAVALAIFDGEDTSRYPEWDSYYKKAERNLNEQEARRVLRAELRRRLLSDRELDRFDELFYDLQEDRTLRAGIETVADEAELDLGAHEEYR